MSIPAPAEVITSASLAAALRTAYQPGVLTTSVTYLVHAGPATAWVKADTTEATVGTELPEFSPDITLNAGPQFRLLLAGNISATDALQSDVVVIDEPKHALELFTKAFHVPLDETTDSAPAPNT